jgi:hypothetical protein
VSRVARAGNASRSGPRQKVSCLTTVPRQCRQCILL